MSALSFGRTHSLWDAVFVSDLLLKEQETYARALRAFPGVAPPPARMAISVVTHATVPDPSLPIIQFRGSDRVWVALEARGPLHVEKPMGPGCRILGQAEDRCVSGPSLPSLEQVRSPQLQVPMHIPKDDLRTVPVQYHLDGARGRDLSVGCRSAFGTSLRRLAGTGANKNHTLDSQRTRCSRANAASTSLLVENIWGCSCTLDQLNVFDLVTVEGLCRRLQLWEEFYGTRLKATSEGRQLCVVVRRTWKSSWDAREIRSDRRWCASLVILDHRASRRAMRHSRRTSQRPSTKGARRY